MRSLATLPAVLVAVVLLLAPRAAATQNAIPRPAGTPVAGVATELLFEVILPAEFLPTGEVSVFFDTLTYAPASEWNIPPLAPIEGIVAEVVLAGTFAATSAGPLLVLRAAGAAEEIPPGTEVVLGPGDGVVWLEWAAARTIRNPGADLTFTLSVQMNSGEAPATPVPTELFEGFELHHLMGGISTTEWAGSGLAGGPVRVRIERVTVAPGVSLPPSTDPHPVLRFVDAGELDLDVQVPGETVTPAYFPLHFRAEQYVPWIPLSEGRRLVLQSVGDEPLVLLVMTLSPVERAGTPETGTPPP